MKKGGGGGRVGKREREGWAEGEGERNVCMKGGNEKKGGGGKGMGKRKEGGRRGSKVGIREKVRWGREGVYGVGGGKGRGGGQVGRVRNKESTGFSQLAGGGRRKGRKRGRRGGEGGGRGG